MDKRTSRCSKRRNSRHYRIVVYEYRRWIEVVASNVEKDVLLFAFDWRTEVRIPLMTGEELIRRREERRRAL